MKPIVVTVEIQLDPDTGRATAEPVRMGARRAPREDSRQLELPFPDSTSGMQSPFGYDGKYE
jgi:hypothetical protein